MMTANAQLCLFLVFFWSLLSGWVKLSNWREGKRFSDGPSLIPLIPFVPLITGLVGWLVNEFASPWGTWGVVGLHSGTLVVGLICIMVNDSKT